MEYRYIRSKFDNIGSFWRKRALLTGLLNVYKLHIVHLQLQASRIDKH